MVEEIGHVYFVKPESVDRVKIGFCKGNPFDRIANLVTASPFPLKMLGAIPCKRSEELERCLHRRFAENRVHNEWFELNEEIQRFISETAMHPAYDLDGNLIGHFQSQQEAKQAEKALYETKFYSLINGTFPLKNPRQSINREAIKEKDAHRLVGYITEPHGLTQRAIIRAAGAWTPSISKARTLAALAAMEAAGRISIKAGARGAKLYEVSNTDSKSNFDYLEKKP